MIELAGVGRTYSPLGGRPLRAVDDMTFTVRAGEVFGIAGPNGAGKSTMISMLLGFLPPSEGRIMVDGRAPREFVEREGIGYLSELIDINPRWRARETMVRFATLAGVPAAELDARVDAQMRAMALDEHARKRVKELSKGTRQRLALAQALLGETRVLILDEPTHGLDPLWTQRFRELLPTLRRPDRAIIVASHNLDELERLADRVAIVDRGRLQRIVATRGAVSETVVTRYRIAYRGADDALREVFPDAAPLGPGEVEVRVAGLEALNRGLATLIGRGVLIVAASPSYSALEEQFRQVVRSDP
ncbi:MAG: ABC transporter ATP-binding protein [Gemmatimonadaceae bacterium]|nr:ABC transporter ATP-binding protein [Gemmatimonadaceae bacterium]